MPQISSKRSDLATSRRPTPGRNGNRAQRVELVKKSRFHGFNTTAVATARTWRLAPATRGGVAVVSETDIEIVFQLTKNRQPLPLSFPSGSGKGQLT
ncbi:MAG: hypothetical protein ACI90M_002791 [Candidatus Azotimanducaceae bacterium]